MNRRRFVKLSTMAALANPIKGMVSSKSKKNSNRSKGHIAVIGAGAFGGWTAFNLLNRGYKITLLDAWGPGNSRASSGGDSRVIRGVYGPNRIYIELVARSFKLWKRYQKRWHQQLYFPTGVLWMFQGEDMYARSSLPILTELGLRNEELTRKEAGKRFPQINMEDVRSFFYEYEGGYLPARHCCQVVMFLLADLG